MVILPMELDLFLGVHMTCNELKDIDRLGALYLAEMFLAEGLRFKAQSIDY